MTNEQQRIGRTVAESTQHWPARRTAPPAAPNIVLIVLDDVGFAQLGCFGSSIRTPAIDRLAREGLRYTNFHTTAVCSPTRASLLTGRNCHAVGFGHITERFAGYPGYSMQLPDSAATIAEVLRGTGYSTWAVGKWHLTASYETGPQGPFDRWPLGRGFERFYGFLGASTDQFAPELYRDNSPAAVPEGEGYHLSADLVDESIRLLRDHVSLAPQQPFLLNLAFGACHVPHQAPREWIDAYRGEFDHGWDVERERVLARQVESGVMAPGTRLGQANPGVAPWDSLPQAQRQLFARMMEVYAGFLSFTDAQIGRLLDALEDAGVLDDTLVMVCSDNGASSEGGPEGSVDDALYLNELPQRADEALAHLDELGGPRLYNHYPWGWAQAGNTPFRWYKQFTHAGGITNGLVLRWPAGGVPAGGIRRQYHHVIDVVPTLLDAVGIEPPSQVRGVTQQPLHGVSMAYTYRDEGAPSRRHAQHYEMWGNRGMWVDGWMAVCRAQPDAAGASPPAAMTVPFEELPWELYHHETDPTECDDLAAAHPATLRELVELWWAAAGRYDVLPVDDRPRGQRWPVAPPLPAGSAGGPTTFLGSGGPYEHGVAPALAGRSFRLVADVSLDPGSSGVLYQLGGAHGGFCWYLHDGELRLEIARSSVHTQTVSAQERVEVGRHILEADVDVAPGLLGRVELRLDGHPIGGAPEVMLPRRVQIGCARTYVGYAATPTAARAFAPPFRLTGVVHRLTVHTGPPPNSAAAVEIAAEMHTQ